MAYSDFNLRAVTTTFGLTARMERLFGDLIPVPIPDWLRDQLARGLQLRLASEKARGELIVMPVLLACRELSGNAVAIYSGVRLDIDPARGLLGECDFLLSRSPPLPEPEPPFVTMVEAKKTDIELAHGQCAAQMVGAQLFNERSGGPAAPVYGCVTTGEAWQFLRLARAELTVDADRYYLSQLDRILAVFQAIFAETSPQVASP